MEFNIDAFILDVVSAAITIVIYYTVAKLFERWIKGLISKEEIKKFLSSVGIDLKTVDFFIKFVRNSIIIVGVILGLASFNTTMFFMEFAFLLFLIFVGLALFFSVKDIIPNMSAQLFLVNNKLLKEGDKIVYGENLVRGRIEKITILNTVIDLSDKKVIIPNRLLLKQKIEVVKKGK